MVDMHIWTAQPKLDDAIDHSTASWAPSRTIADRPVRTVIDLRARAAELRRMAPTARTADTRNALVVLAQRFDELATRRWPSAPVNHRRTTSSGTKIDPPTIHATSTDLRSDFYD